MVFGALLEHDGVTWLSRSQVSEWLIELVEHTMDAEITNYRSGMFARKSYDAVARLRFNLHFNHSRCENDPRVRLEGTASKCLLK